MFVADSRLCFMSRSLLRTQCDLALMCMCLYIYIYMYIHMCVYIYIYIYFFPGRSDNAFLPLAWVPAHWARAAGRCLGQRRTTRQRGGN